MTKRELDSLIEEMWAVGIAALRKAYPNAGYCAWDKLPDHQRIGWNAAVKHAVKTLRRHENKTTPKAPRG